MTSRLHFPRRVIAIAAALIVVLSLSPTAVRAWDVPPPCAPAFGAIETYHEPEIADLLGLGWTRIIFYWSELKKDGPDEWNIFHQPMARIDRELDGGREVVGVLQHTPAFATDGSPGSGVPRGLYLPLDDPGNEWAVFLREVMETYKGRVRRWLIWNEPDIPPDVYGTLWEGSIEDYYQLVKTAALIAEEIDPEIQIHLGGLTYWHNPAYLDEFLDVVAADPTAAEHSHYFDVVSVHIYFKPETTIDILNTLNAALDSYGLDKPIWLNETNAPPYDDPAQPWTDAPFRVTQEEQASFLLQEFAIALAEGVERVSLYKFIDEPPLEPGFEPYGLIRTDRSTRPGYAAFETAITYFSHVEAGRWFGGHEIAGVALARADGLTTRVIWSRQPQAYLTRVPSLAESALLVNHRGEELTIYPENGYYWLALKPASREGDEPPLMGGEPLLLIEEVVADLNNPGLIGEPAGILRHAEDADNFVYQTEPGLEPDGWIPLAVGILIIGAVLVFLLRRWRHGH